MVRFDFTSSIGPTLTRFSADLFQLIDLAPYAAAIDTGNVTADADFFVNRVLGDAQTDTGFVISIRAHVGNPSQFPADPLGFIAGINASILTDGDIGTWEQVAGSLLLPSNTDYLSVRIAAAENIFNDGSLPEFDGHYGDDVSLILSLGTEPVAIPEPHLAWLGLFILGWGRWRLRPVSDA